MDFGSTWPSQVDSSGSRACTSPPSRYQSSMVATVKACRRSCSLGARRPGGAWMPAAATSVANVCWRLCPSSGLPRLFTRNVAASGSGNAWSRARS